MKRLVTATLALCGLLSSCVPAPLRANPAAEVRLMVSPTGPAAQPITGEAGVYRLPGPGSLTVQTDRAASVTAIVLLPSAGARVGQTVSTVPGQPLRLPLPDTEGFTQVFTVASLVPLDLRRVEGARSVAEVARAVEQATQAAPRGAYTVATTVYRAERLGTLRVTSNVPGAQVQVNGRVAGETPVQLDDLPPGQVEVTVTRSGYRPATQRVNVTGDTVTVTDVTLRPLAGTLRVQSSVPADVLVERQPVGVALPGQVLDVALRPGVLSVSVVPRDRTLAAQNLLVRLNDAQISRLECAVASGAYTCTVK